MSKRFKARVVSWVGVYTLLLFAPLAVAQVPNPLPSRGFWVEFGVGLGFVGLAMMGLQFVLTARFKGIAPSFGTDALLQFHRQAGIVSFWFILGHVIVLLIADPSFASFFDPRVNAPRAFALTTVLALLALLVISTLWRKRFGIAYEWWRLTHGLMAVIIVLIALAHVLMVSHHIDTAWKKALWTLLTLAAIGLVAHVRILKPLTLLKHPYRVASVQPEANNVWTVTLEPDGHTGLTFQPGQFVWATFGPTPFTLQQHPFTVASSAHEPTRVQLTIKELGDFTRTIDQLETGTRAYLEGPYGAFTPEEPPSPGAILIAGGIGITPIMSILRTLHDKQDDRPLTLLYASTTLQETPFLNELETLQDTLNLDIVHVLEDPPDSWDGPTGWITPERLNETLPPNHQDHEHFVCGPEPMMDLVEQHLLDQGTPLHRIRIERFNIA